MTLPPIGVQIPRRNTDVNGQISKKHGNTLVSTLRKIYGNSFTAGHPPTSTLDEVLQKLGETSLSQLVRDHETHYLDKKIARAS